MTEKSKAGSGRPKISDLKINKETVQDLTEGETEGIEGGAKPQTQYHCPSHRPDGCHPSGVLTGCKRTGCPEAVNNPP